MKYTEKLGLKKPELTDYVNIEDINDNMDVLDEEVGNLKEGSTTIEELQTSNKTLAGAINELKDEVDSKESPSGAQAKANAALNAAKQYTDEEVGKIADELNAHKADKVNPHGVTKTQIGLGNVDNVKQMPIAGGTFTGPAYAQANTAYTTAQLRNIILSTADASGSAPNGTIWIKYKP